MSERNTAGEKLIAAQWDHDNRITYIPPKL